MISALVHAELNGEPVPLINILGFEFTMVTGGNDTTTGLLSGAAEHLTRNPDQRRLLAAEPGRIPNALEEFLRLTSPVQGLARTTTRDVDHRRNDNSQRPKSHASLRVSESRRARVWRKR